jgi:hypothetical protein
LAAPEMIELNINYKGLINMHFMIYTSEHKDLRKLSGERGFFCICLTGNK